MKTNNKTQGFASQIEVNNSRFTSNGEGDEPERPPHESFNKDYMIHKGSFKKKKKMKKMHSGYLMMKGAKKSVTIRYSPI